MKTQKSRSIWASLINVTLVFGLLGYAMVSAQAQTNNFNTLDHGQTAGGLQTATSVVSISSATAPSSGQCLTATSSTSANWQSCGGSSSWSSLTAPTTNNSVTATVDTSQALLGHFDTSAAASSALFSLGEDVASTKTGATNALKVKVMTIGTLSGSTAIPLSITTQGTPTFNILPTGGISSVSLNDSATGSGGGAQTIASGAGGNTNPAGSISLIAGIASGGGGGTVNITAGADTAAGAGGSVVLTAGVSASGTGGIISMVGNAGTSAHQSYATSTTPSIASGACGTGTNGTISGTDQSGKITIGAVATTSCAVTFGSSTWASNPTGCTITAASAASAATTVLPYISAVSSSGFTLSGSVLASTSFYYHCE